MRCWHCNTKLIWGGDHDISEEDDDFIMSTNLSCPNDDCNAEVQVYLPRKDVVQMNLNKLMKDLKDDEGVVYELYKDHLGLLTGGCGHLIRQSEPEYKQEVGTPISKERVEDWFRDDLDSVLREIKALYVNFDQLEEEAQLCLANMLFNLGFRRLSKFKDLKKAVLAQDYMAMAAAMRDSKWWNQVNNRAERLCKRMEKCAK